MRNILSKSYFNKGNLGFSYVALLSMMAKGGKISYRDLIGALVVRDLDTKRIPRRITAKNILKLTNIGYMESLLGSVLRGVDLPRPVKMVTEYEETFFKNAVFKKLTNHFLPG
jgi:hypothetical protein